MRGIVWKQSARALLVAVATVAGLNGLAPEAKAFQFNSGDVVLAIFGNNQEYITDLGQISSVLPASGLTNMFNIGASSLNPFIATAGSNPVQWTLLEYQGTNAATNIIYSVSSRDAATLTALGTNSVNGVRSALVGWNGALSQPGVGGGAGLGAEVLLDSQNPASFSKTFGPGSGLAGLFVGPMQGSFDSILNVIRGQNAGGNILSDQGRAVLLATGQLQICGGAGCTPAPVPVPAAAMLFASGLIGLVGLARRKLTHSAS